MAGQGSEISGFSKLPTREEGSQPVHGGQLRTDRCVVGRRGQVRPFASRGFGRSPVLCEHLVAVIITPLRFSVAAVHRRVSKLEVRATRIVSAVRRTHRRIEGCLTSCVVCNIEIVHICVVDGFVLAVMYSWGAEGRRIAIVFFHNPFGV